MNIRLTLPNLIAAMFGCLLLGHEVVAIEGREQVDPNPPRSITVPTGTITQSSYSISWSPASFAYRYKLQEQKNGGSWVQIYYSSGTSTTVSGRGLGDYRYRVRAVSRDGVPSAYTYSSVVKVRLPAPSVTVSGQSDPYDNLYLLSWTAVSGAGGYWIAGDINGACVTSSCLLKFVPASQRSIWNNALPAQFSGLGNFRYWIVTCDANGNYCGPGGAKRSVSVSAIVPPSSITAPTSTDLDGAYTVSWPSVSASASYRLQESKNGGAYVTVHAGTARSKALSGRGIGDYRYRVRSENSNGSSGWRYSGTVPVRRGLPTLSISGKSNNYDNSYILNWTGVSGAETYSVEGYVNGTCYGGGACRVTLVGSGTTSIASSALPAGFSQAGTHTLRVATCGANGNYCYRGSGVTVTIQVPPIPASLSAPTSTDFDGSFTISWAASSGASSYTLQQSKNSGAWTTIYTGGNLSKAFTGLGIGDYTYRVRSNSPVGSSGWRTSAVTPIRRLPPTPTISGKSDDYDSVYALNWNSVSGAETYWVYGWNDGACYGGGSCQAYRVGGATTSVPSTSLPISFRQIGTHELRVATCDANGQYCYGGAGWVGVTLTILPGTAPTTTTFEYDALGRLIRVDKTGRNPVDYDYDDAGNRESVTEVSQ